MSTHARNIIAAAALLALAATSAHASAGMSCEASDKAVKLAIEAGISRGVGDDFFMTTSQNGLMIRP